MLWEHIHFCKSRQRFASAKPRFGATHAQRRQASMHACMHARKQASKQASKLGNRTFAYDRNKEKRFCLSPLFPLKNAQDLGRLRARNAIFLSTKNTNKQMHVRAFAYGFFLKRTRTWPAPRAQRCFLYDPACAQSFSYFQQKYGTQNGPPRARSAFFVRKPGGATRRRRLGLDQKSDKIGPKIFDATI